MSRPLATVVSHDALRAACQPDKVWSARALEDLPQDIILPLLDEIEALRLVVEEAAAALERQRTDTARILRLAAKLTRLAEALPVGAPAEGQT